MQKINIMISILFFVTLLIIILIKKYKKIELKQIDINDFLKNNRNKIICIVFIILLICISRIYEFGRIPYAIGVDEAASAYDSYCIANFGVDRYLNSYPLYLINFGGGQSVLYAYLNVLLIKILGTNTLLISRMPALIMFLLSIFFSYKLVNKKQDNKTAILLAFMITICPWHIIHSRFGLDCNLLGAIFILDLFILENAKKNYQYVLAGISIGLTLYTYCLSYIIMPVFLLVWTIYKLYTKSIKIKQILIIAVVTLIFALPLFYLILVNTGLVQDTHLAIFTIPKLLEFRTKEISILNIFATGLESIKGVLLTHNSIYILQVPFFIIGIYKGIKSTLLSIKTRKYCFCAFMTLTFFSILIPNLFVCFNSINKGNILFIPILYFVVMGMLEILKNKKILWQILIGTYLILFTLFEIEYYTEFGVKENCAYEDFSITEVMQYIEDTGKIKEDVYFFIKNKSEPYIYVLFKNKISPYEFDKTKVYEQLKIKGRTINHLKQFSNYHFLDTDSIEEYSDKRTYIVDKQLEIVINILEQAGYKKEEYKQYYIFI